MKTSRSVLPAPAEAPSRVPVPDPELQLLALLDFVRAGAYTCDAEGLITGYNETAARVWGRRPLLNDPRDRFCGSFKMFSSDGEPVVHENCWMALALRERRPYNGMEIVIERPDGQRIYALAHANPIRNASGAVTGAINVVVDITDRKRSEETLIGLKNELSTQLADLGRLHELSTRLSTTPELRPILEETLRTATAIAGGDFGLITLADAAGERIELGASLGLSDEFLSLMTGEPTGVGATGACFRERRRVVVADVETDPLFESHREVARRAGFRSVSSTPLVTRSGRMRGVLSLYFRQPRVPSEREIELVELCARHAVDFIENATLVEQLRDNDRAKNEFLAVLGHELRNPLAPLGNAIQVLELQGELSSESRFALDVIGRQSQQMTRLIDDLLDVARITNNKLELRRELVDLSAVLEAAAETSRPAIDAAGHEFEVVLPVQPVRVDGDLARLAQVVSNLLNNAAKFTPPRGRVWLAGERQGSDAVIRVGDTGVGIAADMLPRIFEMFAQGRGSVDQPTSGLGVGLTLAKRLVEMHGGSVRVHSAGPGRGSEFTIRLPAIVDATRRSPDPRIEQLAPGVKQRLLVVDDNQDSASSLSLLLGMLGSEVRVANDGREAILVAEEYRPKAIVLDIGLPGMNGYEVARYVRQQPWGRRVVLIATTGWSQESDRRRSREAGFDHHLVKPVDPAVLLKILASLEEDKTPA